MAEYIPITDQEIEPEAPITSILQHKLRDNPIAIAEGSPGAPIFQVFADGLSIATWERIFSSSFTGNIVQGGGIYGKTFEFEAFYVDLGNNSSFSDTMYALDSKVGARSINVGVTCTSIGSQVAKLFVNYNAPKQIQEYSWIFILKDNITDKVESTTFQQHHISLGMQSFVDHPFINEDLTNKSVFVVNLTKQQTDILKIKTIPSTDGLFFNDVSTFDPQLIDYSRTRKSMLDVFGENYTFDYNPLPWLADDRFSVLSPYVDGIFPYIKIPEAPDVTRVGVISI